MPLIITPCRSPYINVRAQYGLIKTLFYSVCSFVFFVFGLNIHSDNRKHGSEDVAVSVVVGVVLGNERKKKGFGTR
jgi:hypothetical protein